MHWTFTPLNLNDVDTTFIPVKTTRTVEVSDNSIITEVLPSKCVYCQLSQHFYRLNLVKPTGCMMLQDYKILTRVQTQQQKKIVDPKLWV